MLMIRTIFAPQTKNYDMRITKSVLTLCTIAAMAAASPLWAQNDSTAAKSRLTVGGYGEAVFKYNFFSDNPKRYLNPGNYADAPGHGRLDLPHAVIMLGYDFGHGWTVGTEIEFEHGGTEAAVEMEADEATEFEKEIERGGEVALEQFWVQKSFGQAFNIRAGHIVVPVGMTNSNHLPTQFFGVYRPEGENTIMPCTWHETGLSLWGRLGAWRYELQLLPALNSRMMTSYGWVHNASASPYEFRVANHPAGAARIDWTGLKGLRLSLSGYVGSPFNNDIRTDVYTETSKWYGVKGTVAIAAFDFAYSNRWLTLRGNADYGTLGDAALISAQNKSQAHSSSSPYPHSTVGEHAWDAGIEAGVDLFQLMGTSTLKQSSNQAIKQSKLILFGRYDHYDSFVPATDQIDVEEAERQVVSAGINYYPMPQIAVKLEGGVRLFAEQYNIEPFIALGITWAGFFNR